MSTQTTLPPPPVRHNTPLAPVGRPQPPAPQPPRNQWLELLTTRTLLGRFRVLTLLIIVLAALALIVSFLVLTAQEQNFRQVATRLTPSIAAAEELGQALEDMDSRAADYQLTSRIDVTNPDFKANVYGAQGLRATAWNDLENRRRAVDNALALLRSKVGSDQGEANYQAELEALNRIDNRFYDYYAKINLMKYELDQGHKEAALANYKAAEDILVGNLGQAARNDQGNSVEKALKDNSWQPVSFKGQTVNFDVTTTYDGIAANVHKVSLINQQRLESAGSSLLVLIVFVVAALVLVAALAVSVYYALITHRLLNIGFGLAFLAGLLLLVGLVLALGKAGSDYDKIKNTYVQNIIQSSTIQQVSADANADLSRLLLSPDSPGLDSTQPALTSEVKKAFSRDVLIASFKNKSQEVTQALQNLGLPTSDWSNFTTKATQLQTDFDQKQLAAAILLAIGTDPNSARLSYNTFSTNISQNATSYRQSFDQTACGAIGQSQFANPCSALGGGYLNLLELLVWVIYPLVALFAAFGIWLTTRLF